MNWNCQHCGAPFDIAPDDLSFYDKVSPVFEGKKYAIPVPTFCPDCRQQRRLSWRNERFLYNDTCDLCQKSIVSMYAPGSPYTVYCYECWWGDTWDGLEYGRDVDFSRPISAQLHDLRLRVPRLYLFNLHSENSIYTSHSSNNKNCYMGVALGKCEDCYFGHWVLDSKNVVDAMYCEFCERCYECSYCRHCYASYFSQYCESCRDSLLCYECKGCEQCIGCVGLQQKKHYVLNQPVTQEEYDALREKLLTSRTAFHDFFREYEKLKLASPHRYVLQINCMHSTGNDLYNCKNAIHCFNCRNVEDCKYMYDLGKNKDCMDCYEHGWLVPSELNYELHAGMAGYHLLFCHICAEGRDLLYSDCCFENSKNLFGCISIKHQEYCILNKQYSKEEYERLVPKIIEKMMADHEWGEFLPSTLAPFGYNESVAQEYFPLSKDQALQGGFTWSEYEVPPLSVSKLIKATELPESIAQVQDDILEWAIECEATKKPFKIIKQELDFYRSMNIAIPHFHPDERHRRRMALRNPRKLWERQCAKCGKDIETTYEPSRPEIVYCESCYLSTVS